MPKHPECTSAHLSLEAFVDGDLAEHEARAIRVHLENCPACALEAERAHDLQLALRCLPSFEAPVRLERLERLRAHRNHRWAAAGVAAALVIALSAPLLVSRLLPSNRNAEAEQSLREAKYALALVAKYSRRAGLIPRNEDRRPAPARAALKRTGSHLRHYLGEVPMRRIRNPRGV